jgi:hypothetical protein
MRMNLDESSPVEQTAVMSAATEWANRRDGNPNRRVAKHTEREFEQITCDWLRFAGRLRPRQAALHHQSEIDAFCLYLEKERGLASASIKSTGVNLARFFKGICVRGEPTLPDTCGFAVPVRVPPETALHRSHE